MVLLMGIILIFVPPAVFPDPAQGFQVLRSMQLGGGFNNFVGPDQTDVSQNYTEFLTWWSPGQYLVPYFLQLLASVNTGHAIALTIIVAQFCGLAGFYCFFKKIGFTPLVSAISLVVIICQLGFVTPYINYNGGEVLIFAFEGWFLYGCAALSKTGIRLVLFVLLSGWIGFFLKSSFLWIYAAGLCCLWIRLPLNKAGITGWIKKGLWIGIPAALSVAVIYFLYISRGQSPASEASGFKLAVETFTYPLASPVLSGFSIDDLAHGLIYPLGKPYFSYQWSLVIVCITAILSILLVIAIIRRTDKRDYRLFLAVFYLVSLLFFGFSYLHQLNISYESRHFRILGILILPGLIYLASSVKPVFKWLLLLIFAAIGYTSFSFVTKGFIADSRAARGTSGITQPFIDQQSLNQVMKLDRENKNALFVFISADLSLEIQNNRYIVLSPIGDNLTINTDDYTCKGFAGPLFIVLPESYNGPKEKMIMKSFPGYAGWNISMLSNDYVLYHATLKRK